VSTTATTASRSTACRRAILRSEQQRHALYRLADFAGHHRGLRHQGVRLRRVLRFGRCQHQCRHQVRHQRVPRFGVLHLQELGRHGRQDPVQADRQRVPTRRSTRTPPRA
jgi:hypothetical protein